MINFNIIDLGRLKVKIKENPQSFIAIIGAGVSRPAGLPDWKELKNILIDSLEEKYNTLEDKRSSEIKELRESDDYWYIFETLKKELGYHQYTRIVRESLDIGNKHIPPVYKNNPLENFKRLRGLCSRT